MKKSRVNLNKLTVLEAEKQSKRIAAEIEEELDATGQESDVKAVKWVQEKGREAEHEENEELAEAEWKATDASKKGKVFTYRDVLMDFIKREMMSYYDVLPVNFLWYPVKDKNQGIIIWIRDSRGKWYARGMRVSMLPKYDINCVQKLIVKALDQMDNLSQRYEDEEKQVEQLKNLR